MPCSRSRTWRTVRLCGKVLAVLAVCFCVLVVWAFWRRRRRRTTFSESSPSAELLWRLGRWHHRNHEEVQALTAYYWAKEVQLNADTYWSVLTPRLLYDIGASTDGSSSSWALAEKLLVYKELASVLEQRDWEEYLGLLTDQTEAIRDIGMAALQRKNVELESNSWQISLRLCLATNCGGTIRHVEILLRVGVSLSKKPGKDLRNVLGIYEEAERLLHQLEQQNHQLHAILVHNIGATHGQMGNRKGEWHYFEKALQIYRNVTNNYTETFASLLYEVAMAREEMGDMHGGIEAFTEAQAFFLSNPGVGDRLRAGHVGAIGDMRRNGGNLAGALHAYEVTEKVHQRSGTANDNDGQLIQKNLKELKERINTLPEKKQWLLFRDLELYRRPAVPESEDLQEGTYLQYAGR